MLKKILLGIGVLVILFALWVVYGLFIAKPASPKATATYSDMGVDVTVTYSQPYKKGRLLFGTEADGALQPYGKYWRLGANAATEITLSTDVYFGGNDLKAGTYRMYAIPGPDVFQVILNTEAGVFFGAVEPNRELDIVTVDAPVKSQDQVVEMFTVQFSSDSASINMDFVWDNILFSVPITPKK